MCVEVSKNAEQHKRVVGYKMFRVVDGHLIGLVYGAGIDYPGFYRISRKYKATGPGFQAYVTKKLAQQALKKNWGGPGRKKTVIRKVVLYNAQKGIIKGMDNTSDGHDAWTGRAMKIERP